MGRKACGIKRNDFDVHVDNDDEYDDDDDNNNSNNNNNLRFMK